MAISNRTATTANSGSAAATSLVLNAPTGETTGDFLITTLSLNGGSGITVTPPAGWTLLKRTNNTTVLGQAIYWKIATASEPGSYTWTVTSCFCSGVMNAYTGVDNNNPIAGDTVLAKTTASTSATFGACIPQAESVYGVLSISGQNTTASTTISAASSGYTINGQTCTTATNFIVAAQQDQHTPYGLPLASVTPGSATFSTSSTDIDNVLFLRPTVTTATGGFSIDLATFAAELTDSAGGVTTASFSTGYNNEVIVAIIAGDASSTSNMTVSGGSLTWTRQVSQITASGSSYLYTAVAATPVSNITVTFSDTGDTTTSVGVALYSFLGVNTTTPIGNSTQQNTGVAGAMNLSVTTSGNNSWVWANYNDFTANTSPTAGTNQTKVSDIANAGDGNRYAAIRQNAVTASSGTAVTMSTTAPTADTILAFGFEIMAAPVGGTPTNLFFY